VKRLDKKITVAVAMSGGIDSSVAAALLAKKGFKVIGLTMKLFPSFGAHSSTGCCADEAIDSASRIALRLGIAHEVIDYEKDFQRLVVDDFLNEYGNARTPNPCVVCNKSVKFGLLMETAKKMGCEFLATGHYARILKRQGEFILARAKDGAKDQSYFLWMLSREQLGTTLFPLGSFRKQKVRDMALDFGIESPDRPESQEICFIPRGHYSEFINSRSKGAEGDIVDVNGRILGKHKGIAGYTVGQREGLGIALGRPQYVIALDHDSNRVIVGDNDLLLKDSFEASRVNWFIKVPIKPINATVKIRNQHKGTEATVEPSGVDSVRVVFTEKQRAITPGQSAVFYQGDMVLGGGIIK
jgi:tRNA-specific 2-thiouridylase